MISLNSSVQRFGGRVCFVLLGFFFCFGFLGVCFGFFWMFVFQLGFCSSDQPESHFIQTKTTLILWQSSCLHLQNPGILSLFLTNLNELRSPYSSVAIRDDKGSVDLVLRCVYTWYIHNLVSLNQICISGPFSDTTRILLFGENMFRSRQALLEEK